MSNRTLIYLTCLVIAGILVLFALNMRSILSGQPEGETYLKYNQVRGMAIVHQEKPYTLNFKQQNDVIDMLNRALPIEEIKSGKRQNPDFEKIIVYQFNDQPDLTLTPVTYVDDNLVFSMPKWNANGYLMEVSEGRLKQLLSQTYDHE